MSILSPISSCARVMVGLCLTCALCSPFGGAVSAQTGPEPETEQTQQMPEWIDPPQFEYTARDQGDPFRSFLHTQQEEKADQKPDQSLSPLQRVQPSQLKLVGTLHPKDQDQPLALVELPNGKGYILHPGASIGRNQGRVTHISRQKVVIIEETTTLLGQEAKHTVTLKIAGASGAEDAK